jgi:phage terminase small subunit
MPILSNPRHERFVQLVASGMSATKAYVEAGYAEQGANVNASRLIANDSVSARITELKERTASACEITRQEVLRFLSDIVRMDLNEQRSHRTSLGPQKSSLRCAAGMHQRSNRLARLMS